MEQEVQDSLRVFEESLWRAETRFDPDYMNALLAETFYEFGRSGRIYSRCDILPNAGATATIEATLPLREFRVREIAANVALVTYVSEQRISTGIERSNRSSLWKRGIKGWQICFHQGTPTD